MFTNSKTTRILASHVHNLTGKMNMHSLNKSRNKIISGWARIPNCAEFDITKTEFDPKWKSVGLEVKIKPNKHFTPYYNKKMVEYMAYQIARLRNTKDPVKFFKIVWFLMKHSASFRISGIQKVFPLWYKNYPLWWILRLNRRVTKLIMKEDDNLKYKRVYIPKGETFRPLGVPTPEWRLYIHMFTNFMQIYLQEHLLSSQHGFIPGRGTATCWTEVFDRIINSKYIYECDLKQFFPSVHANYISERLMKLGMPRQWVYWLQNINIIQPDLPKDLKLDETRIVETKQDQHDVMNGIFRYESKLYDPYRNLTRNELNDRLDAVGASNLFELVQLEWAMRDSQTGPDTYEKVGTFMEGVPVGLPSSPLLSILTLKEFLTQENSISYADDPIFYGEKPFNIKDQPDRGIVINQEKSRWVKKDGKWLTKLKYLGLEYDPTDDSLNGSTKKGSTLKLTSFHRDLILKVFEVKTPGWQGLLNSKLWGTIQARLYAGSFKIDNIIQDFRLGGRGDSLIHSKPFHSFDHDIDTFNASSFASYWLHCKIHQNKRKRLGLRKSNLFHSFRRIS